LRLYITIAATYSWSRLSCLTEFV